MPGPPSPSTIETVKDAQAFFSFCLAGSHKITCYGRAVTIVFESDATHLFSEAPEDPNAIPAEERVERRIPAGKRPRVEVRQFSRDRARLMGEILHAISRFTVSVPSSGGPPGRQKRVLYGPQLPDGRWLRVVLRPGPETAFTCVSAYPVERHEWLAARRQPRAKFPP